jgi:hypothetical protein
MRNRGAGNALERGAVAAVDAAVDVAVGVGVGVAIGVAAAAAVVAVAAAAAAAVDFEGFAAIVFAVVDTSTGTRAAAGLALLLDFAVGVVIFVAATGAPLLDAEIVPDVGDIDTAWDGGFGVVVAGVCGSSSMPA